MGNRISYLIELENIAHQVCLFRIIRSCFFFPVIKTDVNFSFRLPETTSEATISKFELLFSIFILDSRLSCVKLNFNFFNW